MPPTRSREHEWTRFELHTMLCLIARGAHLAERPSKRTDNSDLTRGNTYEKFATLFNEAVHGKFNYAADLDKREIIRMLETLLVKRMNVVGKNGLVERQRGGRITRALRLAWERTDGRDFDGSIAEWEGGRREKVIKQDMIARGLIPEDDAMAEESAAANAANRNNSSLPTFNTYTSEPVKVSAAYARRYTPRAGQKASTEDSIQMSSYLNQQLENVNTSAPSASRTPNRGKKSQLSAAYIDHADTNDHDFPAPPPKILAASTIAKKHDAAMNTLSSFAVIPSKLRESSKFDWMNDRAAKPMDTPIDASVPNGRVGAKGEIVKLKRPGRNAGRKETYSNKGLSGEMERSADGFGAGNNISTGAHGQNPEIPYGTTINAHPTSSSFEVPGSSAVPAQFHAQKPPGSAEFAANRAFDQDMNYTRSRIFDGNAAQNGGHVHGYGNGSTQATSSDVEANHNVEEESEEE